MRERVKVNDFYFVRHPCCGRTVFVLYILHEYCTGLYNYAFEVFIKSIPTLQLFISYQQDYRDGAKEAF